MIIVYASSNGLTPKLRAKLNSIKAQRQPRLKNGQFMRVLTTPSAINQVVIKPKSLPKPAAIEKNPLVEFFYPMSSNPGNSMKRTVRLISSNAICFTGLEKTDAGWKFKKFLQPKAQQFRVVSFNPKSMS